MSEVKETKPAAEEKAPAAAAGATPAADGAPAVRKKKSKKNVSSGNVYVQSSFNNTIVTVTDTMGNVIC